MPGSQGHARLQLCSTNPHRRRASQSQPLVWPDNGGLRPKNGGLCPIIREGQMLAPPGAHCTCLELAWRLILFVSGCAVNVWAGARFRQIRATCTFACNEPAGAYAALVPIAFLLIFSALPAMVDTLSTRIAALVGAAYFLLLMVFGQLFMKPCIATCTALHLHSRDQPAKHPLAQMT